MLPNKRNASETKGNGDVLDCFMQQHHNNHILASNQDSLTRQDSDPHSQSNRFVPASSRGAGNGGAGAELPGKVHLSIFNNASDKQRSSQPVLMQIPEHSHSPSGVTTDALKQQQAHLAHLTRDANHISKLHRLQTCTQNVDDATTAAVQPKGGGASKRIFIENSITGIFSNNNNH